MWAVITFICMLRHYKEDSFHIYVYAEVHVLQC